MISKVISSVLALSMATPGIAFGQSSQSQIDKTQLSEQITSESAVLSKLNNEISVLLERIHEKEIDVASDKKVRNISLTVAGLGILEILLVRKFGANSNPNMGRGGIDLSGLVNLGLAIPGIVGLAGGTLTAASTELFILIGSNKLGNLKEELVKKQKVITEAQNKLNILKSTLN